MKYNISHIDTCNSQYFGGHHLPVVQVLVDGNTTYKDIKESLLDIYTSTDHIEDLDEEAYKEAVEELFANFTTLDYVPDSLYGIGSMDGEDEWDCYMYFVVESVEAKPCPVTKYQINNYI